MSCRSNKSQNNFMKSSQNTFVPNTSENDISMQIGEYIKSIQNKKSVGPEEYEYIRLLDSFKFMNASPDRLVRNLLSNQFTLLEQDFQSWPESSTNLL